MKSLLRINDLKTYFHSSQGIVKSVDGVSLEVGFGESVALVGESGCGKSVTSLSIMGLVPTPPGEIVGGDILFENQNLVGLNESGYRQIRGKDISIIFQDPMTSLNPLVKIGHQIGEILRIHKQLTKREAFHQAIELLKEVGIPRAEEVAHNFPHQLSGGMRQRVMIAIAIACKPKLLIADEPTTALDATIQAQIMELIQRLIHTYNMSLLLITHDLGIVAESCDRVIVMYAGKIVEESDAASLFQDSKHPYTVGLLQSVPNLEEEEERLYSIPGVVPSPHQMPQGCAFAPRCDRAMETCFHEAPPLIELNEKRKVRCFLFVEKEGDFSE